MFRTALFVVAILISSAAISTAEPITATFTIRIIEPALVTSFPLTVTFDSAVTEEIRTDAGLFRRYGPPTFSAIPLIRPPVRPDATTQATTEHGWSRFSDGSASYSSLIAQSSEHPASNSLWRLLIRKEGLNFGSVPPLTPASLVAFMGGGPAEFFYDFTLWDDDQGQPVPPGLVGYFGTATLANDIEPVPEPATIALFALGGIVLAARRRSAAHVVSKGR